ncbi:polysaccharide deacetylase family protein [Bacillus sp. FJAT-26390]|uniref:polysaccharide deacetylase family protein n=1 Tax=Bacillus sp. FJAT-26390 TaxID=1743142 RepID=UPI000807F653|nr:polysaccharide deacetylase family protein [Bacillus sp. FJAT-26390]OBZ17820.1 xylanase deacetylase [Bacillus sp. FJAT-26390]
MKRINLTIAILLIGALLASCSEQQPKDNLPASGEAAASQEPSASSTPDTEAALVTSQPAPTESPVSEEETSAAPLYRMSEAYRFVPIEDQTPSKVVLLTFDDGPKDKEVLTSILDTLDRHKAKAIFFVNGYRVKQNPDLLKLINEREQTIGNHSFDHNNLKEESKEVVEKQIGDVQTDVDALIGRKPLFFRPPYGSGSAIVKETAKNHGMLYMTWSNGSLDWDKSAKGKPDVVIKNVLEQLHPGANILMHELKWTADALEELLTALESKGYGFIDPATIELTR